MFLPFLIALGAAFGAITGKDNVSYILWGALTIVTVVSFMQHLTNLLTLSF
ncbi:TPA: hypothetical protein M4K80_004672 [Salmonella enterica]|nr:hypothetical protein [Salmonella enterica]HCC0891041.1 hypothetical protein [Salmonella enterica]